MTALLLLSLSLLRPSFAQEILFTMELDSCSFGGGAIADLDGDGDQEILFGTYLGDERVLALHHDGSTAWTQPSDGGPVDSSITTADLDDDGLPEVSWGDSVMTRFHVANHQGVDIWATTLNETIDSPRAIGDVNGDGRLDLVLTSCAALDEGHGLRAFTGISGNLLWEADTPGCYRSAPLLFDQDGDEVLDVVVSTLLDNKVRGFSGLDGTLRWEAEIGDGSYHAGSFGDINGDGVPDVVIGDHSATLWAVDGSKGEILWSQETPWETSLFGPTSMGDVDGDSVLETIVVAQHVHVFDQWGNLQWKQELDEPATRGAVLVDFDGDGLPDILTASAGLKLQVLAGVSGRVLYTAQLESDGQPDPAMDFQPVIWDLDGDGSMELFTVHGRGWSTDEDLNWGRATLLTFGGSGPGWPTFLHDHHNSSNYELPPGAFINDPDYGKKPVDTGGALDTDEEDPSKDTGGAFVKRGACGCGGSRGSESGLALLLGLLPLLVRRRSGIPVHWTPRRKNEDAGGIDRIGLRISDSTSD